MVEPLHVRISLKNIHCVGEGDGLGSAEPYLWTIFFKIDSTNTSIASGGKLVGSAEVIQTEGSRGDLGGGNVDAGDDVPISEALGIYRTIFSPITFLNKPGGAIGFVFVLLEENHTPSDAINAGYLAFGNAIQTELDDLINNYLTVLTPEPTPSKLQEMKNNVNNKVRKAIENKVGAWEYIKNFGDMDKVIGFEAGYMSYDSLISNPLTDIDIGLYPRVPVYDENGNIIGEASLGTWRLTGQFIGLPFNLRRWLEINELDGSQGIRSIMSSLSVSTIKELISSL